MTNQAINSRDYIKSIDFGCVETYSFQQNAYYAETTRNSGTISWHDQRITDPDKKISPSSRKISSFKCTDAEGIRLIRILEIDVMNLPAWMCAPIYRDAIVFYNKDREVVSALNICFECLYMENNMGINIEADERTYDLLKSFLISKGHAIRS